MFDTTRWSLVLGARADSDDGRAALDALCRAYRTPVVSYLRARGCSCSDAEDMTQSFFEHLLVRRIHSTADAARGRFRSFLLGALKHFAANQFARETAIKRGGDFHFVAIEPGLEPASNDDPEWAFEREYALTVVARAMHTLAREAEAAGKGGLFTELRPFLLEAPEPADYANLAERLGMRRNTLAVAIHRLRTRLREIVRAEVMETVDSQAELESEMAALRNALGA